MIYSYKILWTLRNFLSLSSISTNRDTGQFLLKWLIKKYNVNNLCIFVWGFTMLDPSCWSCLRPRSQPTLGQKAAAETAVQSPPCGWKRLPWTYCSAPGIPPWSLALRKVQDGTGLWLCWWRSCRRGCRVMLCFWELVSATLFVLAFLQCTAQC